MTRETRKGRSRSAATKGVSALAALVRQHDRDRYQTALFAPVDKREALFALYAFNYEVARIRESVTEPMLGQIRLQWWREVIDATYAGAPTRAHEVALPLTAAIREYGLSRVHFDRLIDARERDLDDEPPADMAALEDYAEGTSATVIWLALEILDAADPAALSVARDVGIGYALAGLLRAMPFHASTGRRYIPAELSARTGIDPADYERGFVSAGLRAAIGEIATAATGHIDTARDRRGGVRRSATPALLPAIIASRYLNRLRRTGHDPFAAGLSVPDPLQAWRLFGASMTKRF